MLIGELADAAGVPTRTVRYYERRGLLPEPRRAANGYRTYTHDTLTRLTFIRAAQHAGLTLTEIRDIIDLRDDGHTPCSHVTALLTTKLDDVRQRRRQLATLEDELAALIEGSHLLDPADCGERDICHILHTNHHDDRPFSEDST